MNIYSGSAKIAWLTIVNILPFLSTTNMIRIHLAHDIQQANLIVHCLEQHNIKAVILNQYTQGALGELPFTQAYPEIWVEQRFSEDAKKVIDTFEKLPLNDNTVYCANCQEVNPENFETCWSCGTVLKD